MPLTDAAYGIFNSFLLFWREDDAALQQYGTANITIFAGAGRSYNDAVVI